MAILTDIILFLVGFLIVYFSVDFLLDELEEYLENYEISPTVFGFLILGIDLEESLASLISAIEGLPLLSIGNLIGNTIIAISIAFAIPLILTPFEPEAIPNFYYIAFLVSSVNLFVSLFLTQFVWIFGIIAVLLYILILYFSFQYQKIYKQNLDNKLKTDKDDEDISFIKQSLVILVLLILVIVGGELLVRSASNIINETSISESFFGLVILAFVTNVEEFWLMFNSIRKDQIELGISSQIGKIFWNISLIFGISGILIVGYTGELVLLLSGALFLTIVLILTFSLFNNQLKKSTATIFLIILLIFFILNISFLVIY